MPREVGGANLAGFRVNLARARERRNFTQEQLSQALGMSREAVAAWESGRAYPKVEVLYRLAGALNVTLRDLLEGYDVKPRPEPEEVMADAVARRIENGPIGLLAKLFGISLEELNTGHDSVKSALGGAPVDPKEQVVVERFAEVLATKLAAELNKSLVPMLQQTIRESLQRGDDERK